MKLKDFSIGYDIGITSVGWAIMNNEDNSLVDFGVRKFNEAEQAQTARLNRSSRRTLRRKRWRLDQLKQAFVDFNLLTKDDLTEEYLRFYKKNGTVESSEETSKIQDISPYHLRARALKEKVTTRELFLALYNICKTRGHFLLEGIDFSGSGITKEIFSEMFLNLVKEYVEVNDLEKFKEDILNRLYIKHLSQSEIKNIMKYNYCTSEEDNEILKNIIFLITNYKVNLKKISEEIVLDGVGDKTTNINDLKKKDDLNDFLTEIVNVHDTLRVSRILKEDDYVCTKNLKEMDKIFEIQKLKQTDPKGYVELVKKIQGNMKAKDAKLSKGSLKLIKNLNNNYPNGLYEKEVRDILVKQSEFNNKINKEFIEVCSMIVRARIPYYMGPLSIEAKNAWIVRNEGKVKYSYEYALKKQNLFNEEASIIKWKEAMISRCTNLPNEFAMPKGAFRLELINILNEINVLRAETEDVYYLTKEDKIKIINELFLKKRKVYFKSVAEKLSIKKFGIKSNNRDHFNNGFTLYFNIIDVLPEYRLTSIEEVYTNKEKIDFIDELITNLNLFDEYKSKKDYLINKLKINSSKAEKLARINSKGFGSLSKKFLYETVVDQNGETVFEKLLEDNSDNYSNELMTIKTNAMDKNGEVLDFSANKYSEILKLNSNLGIHLLMDKNKPLMPMSRPVIRGLNECFKVHNEIMNLYGVPSRVVIETARDLKDTKQNGEQPARHFDQMKKCYEYLVSQCKERKIKPSIGYEFSALEDYLSSNKRKVELYIRQNGVCLISGDRIDINDFSNYEIDHVLPRGFGDNSMDNLILIRKDINMKKSDRLPIEYLRNEGHIEFLESDYVNRVKQLHLMKLISDNKLKRLLLEDSKEAMGFIQRNLVDTRYIIREFMAILNAHNKHHGNNTKFVALKATFNGIYRNAFDMPKNRDIGDQHHAHDAAMALVVDKCISGIYPNYDSRGNNNAYSKFLDNFIRFEKESTTKEQKEKINDNIRFLRYMYKSAFNESYKATNSFITNIKVRTPLLSWKAEKKFTGEFFNATIYGKKDYSSAAPLSIIGVNNSKRSFNSINCVAVDFYKLTTNKGAKKHFAVHIPKVIVNQNGLINKEKYLLLVKEHYGYNELIDANGNLISGAFRLRMFKNDMFYDTERKEVMLFNIGSIVNKKLELRHINIYSYNKFLNYKEKIWKQINQKRDNKKLSSTDLKDLVVKVIIENVDENLKEKIDVFRSLITDHLKNNDITKVIEYSYWLILKDDSNFRIPKIKGQILPVANNLKQEDSQYIKISSSALGIRVFKKENNLIIEGPNDGEYNNKYSLIKKEKYSWQI